MIVDLNLGKRRNGFQNVQLNPRIQRLIAAKAGLYESHNATLDELDRVAAEIRRSIQGLASQTVLRRLHTHNPAIFQIVREAGSDRVAGMGAQLPLTRTGFEALVTGRFDALSPEHPWVAKPGQPVEAMYVWLTYAPRSLVAVMAGLAEHLQVHCPAGGSLFCTPLGKTEERLITSLGFRPATETYSAAPAGLLVAPRARVVEVGGRGSAAASERSRIEIRVARDFQDIAKVMAVRAATYMFEQECPFDEEFDGNDFSCTHFLGLVDGEPAGCLRIRYFADFVKVERLAVRKEFRTSKLAFRLVREAMCFSAKKGFGWGYGHARRDLVRFWETFGFRAIPGRPPFTFSDVDYIEMEGPIVSKGEKIAFRSDPLRILRPEGEWDNPGVLERASDAARRARIASTIGR